MKKRYLIYWRSQPGIDGNIVMTIDWDKVQLKEVIEEIIDLLNKQNSDIKNLSIPFMVELK